MPSESQEGPSASRNAVRIQFDVRWLGDHGIGRFARELKQRLPEMPAAQLPGEPSDATDCIRTWLWLLRHQRSILFTPGYNAPLFCQARSIITVHDLNHIDSPAPKNMLKKLYYQIVLKRACRNAGTVFTVSEFSRRRILTWSGAAPDQVINVGNGVSEVFCPRERDEARAEPYFLMVSNRKPHKNEQHTFEAFKDAGLPSEVQLLVTGNPTDAQQDWLRDNYLTKRIVFLGPVSDNQLAERYRDALGLVFMSLYEGFGLPVVEAMASGTPVIASNATSLPEVVGEAGILLDPSDRLGLQQTFERIYADPALREHLSKRGLSRATDFQWGRVASKVKARLFH